MGVNIGANTDSEDPVADFVKGIEELGPEADYLVVCSGVQEAEGLAARVMSQILDIMPLPLPLRLRLPLPRLCLCLRLRLCLGATLCLPSCTKCKGLSSVIYICPIRAEALCGNIMLFGIIDQFLHAG